MKSIAYLPASNQSANASLMTVTNIRSAGASTIKVNTVANAPVKFAGTMGTPHTFTDPVTSETITIISEASAVDFFGSISGSDVIIDQIAAGYTDLGSKVGDIIVIKPITEGQNNLYNIMAQSHNDDGSIKDSAIIYQPTAIDAVQSGGIWSALTGLNAAMSALVLYQGGYRGTIAAVASRAFTLNKDTYVDALRTTSGYVNTFSLVYTEVANGAAAPALAANSIRLAKVVTGASVTSITQVGNFDSLGNTIYPVGVNSASTLQTKYRFFAYRAGAWSTNTGGIQIVLDTKTVDYGNNFNVINGRFTAPESGLYRFNASVGFVEATTTQGLVLALYVNGANAKTLLNCQFNNPGGWTAQYTGSGELFLKAGDYVTLFHLGTPSTTGATGIATSLEGYMVAAS